MEKMRNLIVGLCLLTATVTSQGCVLLAGAAVGAGGYAFATGSLSKNLDATTETVHKASLKGLEDLHALLPQYEIFLADWARRNGGGLQKPPVVA